MPFRQEAPDIRHPAWKQSANVQGLPDDRCESCLCAATLCGNRAGAGLNGVSIALNRFTSLRSSTSESTQLFPISFFMLLCSIVLFTPRERCSGDRSKVPDHLRAGPDGKVSAQRRVARFRGLRRSRWENSGQCRKKSSSAFCSTCRLGPDRAALVQVWRNRRRKSLDDRSTISSRSCG